MIGPLTDRAPSHCARPRDTDPRYVLPDGTLAQSDLGRRQPCRLLAQAPQTARDALRAALTHAVTEEETTTSPSTPPSPSAQPPARSTTRSIRPVSLPKHCLRALTQHRAQQERERTVAGKKWQPAPGQPDGLIFTTPTVRVTDPRSLNRMLTLLCRDAGIRRVRVHDLRHACASLLPAQGVDARTIMETLGHGTITTPLDTYAHVMSTTLKASADRMDDVPGSERGGRVG